jgi:hypothetical protein
MFTKQPQKHDAVLGGQNLIDAAVLGGLEGVKQRLNYNNQIQVTQALIDAVQYGTTGKALVRQYFTHPDHSKFFINMLKAGYTPEIAEQRFSWYGPFVNCPNRQQFQQIIRRTRVNLVWDSAGKEGNIIYPAAYSRSKLLSLWFLMQDKENPEAIDLAGNIGICLRQRETLCTLANNLLNQLEEFS